MDHKELAQTLVHSSENIILIYAFNSTGKTRLSIAYKDETKREDGSNTGVYYNAFSEDLFVWDNDSANEGRNVQLKVQNSIFNRFHSSLTEDLISENLRAYLPKYRFRFNFNENPEQGIESVSFFPILPQKKKDNEEEINQIEIDEEEPEFPIKISRGEERIFVWCFVLALFEIGEFFDNQSEFIFIDDPVSSLDEHNIFVTANLIFELIQNHFKERKVIITTHHAGLYSILNDWLKKGDQKQKFENKFQTLILRQDPSANLKIVKDNKDTFLYHLKLFQLLNEAKVSNEVSPFHFALLRQLLENVSSFLGKGYFSYVLDKIEIEDVSQTADRVNALSHKKFYTETSSLLNNDDRRIFDEILSKLKTKFDFSIS
ncbi:AAA family ATPase [Leptospira ilyithenensis]|uniref:Anticodon nuclease n=1 Tax=Leptospira ilyithenensis TaxID=2484901 RepID=A0A4R9LPP2_9LEPT|nr:AAA family ATPase [Leptospira ilyithenensis]TGN09352.1 anticodon nuclease [Leptospira ilyithenensis]